MYYVSIALNFSVSLGEMTLALIWVGPIPSGVTKDIFLNSACPEKRG